MDLFALLPFVLILVVGWLLLMRPQRQRQQRMAEIRAALQPGTEVMMAGGLFGTIVEVNEDSVVVQAAPGVELQYVKDAVLKIQSPVEPSAEIFPDENTSPDEPDDPEDQNPPNDRQG